MLKKNIPPGGGGGSPASCCPPQAAGREAEILQFLTVTVHLFSRCFYPQRRSYLSKQGQSLEQLGKGVAQEPNGDVTLPSLQFKLVTFQSQAPAEPRVSERVSENLYLIVQIR